MTEEKKGHLKVTFEVEMNAEFMGVMKDAMVNMSKMRMKMPEIKPSSEEK